MYKCEDCGHEFEEPLILKERHGLDYGYEEIPVCPACMSSEYTKGTDCPICGEVSYKNHGFCDECMDEAKKLIREDFESLPPAHMSDLIDLLTNAVDEVYTEERRKEWSSGH